MEPLTYFRIGIDDEATELLLQLSVVTGQEPRITLARLVRDILVGDEGQRPVEAHGPHMH